MVGRRRFFGTYRLDFYDDAGGKLNRVTSFEAKSLAQAFANMEFADCPAVEIREGDELVCSFRRTGDGAVWAMSRLPLERRIR